eukprot:m.9429 g.9429  ORF g.9429 m.9429 type:complete len:133 (+) comp5510_c0_seq1:28-426(+)
MSWQDHADALVSTKHVSHAAIHGLDGKKWASTEGFEVGIEEARTIIAAIDSPDYAALLPKTGVFVGGERFTYVRSDQGKNLFARKSGHQVGGLFVSKTTRAVLITLFGDNVSATDCMCEVERLGDYLISMQT